MVLSGRASVASNPQLTIYFCSYSVTSSSETFPSFVRDRVKCRERRRSSFEFSTDGIFNRPSFLSLIARSPYRRGVLDDPRWTLRLYFVVFFRLCFVRLWSFLIVWMLNFTWGVFFFNPSFSTFVLLVFNLSGATIVFISIEIRTLLVPRRFQVLFFFL